VIEITGTTLPAPMVLRPDTVGSFRHTWSLRAIRINVIPPGSGDTILDVVCRAVLVSMVDNAPPTFFVCSLRASQHSKSFSRRETAVLVFVGWCFDQCTVGFASGCGCFHGQFVLVDVFRLPCMRPAFNGSRTPALKLLKLRPF
jgi:hypothetical protein